MNRFWFIFALIAGLAGAFAFGGLPDLPVRLPTDSELTGNWIGYEERFPYFFRLSLLQDKKGFLVISFPKSDPPVSPDIYKVGNWGVQHRQLSLQLSPVKGVDGEIICSVKEFSKTRIKLEVNGATNKWDWTVLLLNESELNKNASNSASYIQNEK